jgi:hypothetical protein
MSSCLPRDEDCKAWHTRDAVRAARWCGVGVVAGAVVRTLHLMFSRFSTFYLSEQGRAQEFFFQMWNYVDTHRYHASSTQTRPCRRLHSAIWQHIGLHFVTLYTFRDTTWHYLTMTSHRMSLDRITHIRDPTCMHICRRHFLIYKYSLNSLDV